MSEYSVDLFRSILIRLKQYWSKFQSWEANLDQNLCYLLRTELAKSTKEQMRLEQFDSEDTVNLSKITKHLGQVLERVGGLSAKIELTIQGKTDSSF